MTVRIGVVGLGNMGTGHCRNLAKLPEYKLSAVADVRTSRVGKLTERYGCAGFSDPVEMIRSGECDAVLIATPHFDHTTIGIAALKQGLHVLVEKPISAHKLDCEKLIRAHGDQKTVFAAMFNQRTNPNYQRIRTMLRDGTLGAVRRFSWTITDWFRPQSYYDSGGWRATWAGEGGGVLLNQSPHQLDLMQWLFGMPDEVQAFCELGKYHDIEVEDSVTARLKFQDGAEGLFVSTTGEAPGINRLEIAAENGLLIYDTSEDDMVFKKNEQSVSQAIAENEPFTAPATEQILFPTGEGEGGQHLEILQNFAAAILDGAELIAPASEGIHSVELANAMLLSGARGKTVSLPMSARSYATQLKKWMATSRYQGPISEGATGDEAVQDINKSWKK